MTERYLRAHSVIEYHNELASNVTNELATRSCITERVKRLAGNEIELGMERPMIESRASNIPTHKGNYVCCHKGLTDKDLHRNVGNNMGSSSRYWLLTEEASRSCVHHSRTHRVRTLNVH